MKTIYIRGGDKEELGVVVLKEHLENKGHRVVRAKTQPYDVVVCWGCSMRDPAVRPVPALNGHVNLYNKYQALGRFLDRGLNIPITVQNTAEYLGARKGPWFGRNFSHEKGKDIQLFDTWADVLKYGNKDYYTKFVPHVAELRAWTYKDRVFAAYQKHYRNPGLDNYKNMEFRSELRDDLLRDGPFMRAAVLATQALRMDFGAVDILQGEDGKYYVLEVNSMPDISSMERASGIRLANIVSDWAETQR